MKKGNVLRRGLAVLLLICMLLSLFPMSIMATESREGSPILTDQEKKPETRAIPQIATLISLIDGLEIPSVTKDTNFMNLGGDYFIVCNGRTFNHSSASGGGIKQTIGYLNMHENDTGLSKKNGIASIPVSLTSVSNNVYRISVNSTATDLTHAITVTKNKTYELDNTFAATLSNELEAALANKLTVTTVANFKNKRLYELMNVDSHDNVDTDQDGYTYDFKFNNSKYLTFNQWENMSLTDEKYPILLHPSKTSGCIKLYKTNVRRQQSNGKDILHSYWIGLDAYGGANIVNSYVITASTSAMIRRNNFGDRTTKPIYSSNLFYTDWTFYKIAPQTLGLYKTLRNQVRAFLNENPMGKYSQQALNGYLLDVEKCINFYKQHYTNTTASDAITKQSNAYCEMLTQSITMMKNEAADKAALDALSANPYGYMDVPITVLDFRSDGLMFENMDDANPYSLSLHSAADQTKMNQNIPVPVPGRYDGSNRVDLTLDSLVDGYPVYRKETVDFIAQALFKKYQIPGAANFDPYWNNIFVNMVNSGFTTDKDGDGITGLGSWENTLSTTSTPNVNGGVLLFNTVDTAYDLAYYILNHIWRPVGADDTIKDSETVNGNTFPVHYNMVVPELHTLRMTKDAYGYYHFKSDQDVGRDLDRGIIFNTGNAWDNKSPALNVLSDLGFEHPNLYGNNNTGTIADRNGSAENVAPRTNYNYGLHIRSVFVYYDDKDLKFTFTGDDDVYFFINDQLACDIGGMHGKVTKNLTLNTLAPKLDLHDGDICTFDMFYVDRHFREINMNFSTNIEMMQAAAVTREDQYYYTGADSMGESIREGSMVDENTEIGYNYKLLNRSDFAVNHVSYADPSLGVTMSKDGIILNEKAQVGDLIITYRSYDTSTSALVENPPTVHTRDTNLPFAENSLYKLIKAAVENKSTVIPMPGQVHEIRGLTEEDLIMLLELGIPANVQMEIYGTHQTAKPDAELKCYSTLKTVCYPLDINDKQGDPLTGTDKRSVVVEGVSAVSVKDPLRIVLDYGKPVEISREQIASVLQIEGSPIVSLVGLTHEGNHGTTMKKQPSNLKCVDPGDSYTSSNGTYELRGTLYRFTLSRFLEEVEKINAVFYVYTPTGTQQWYIMVTVELIPATSVYYEAEDFTSFELSYDEQGADGPKTLFDTQYQDKSNGLLDSTVNSYRSKFNPTSDRSILYFGFNATAEDTARYTGNGNYKKNYDIKASWGGSSGYSLNIGNGTLNYTDIPTTNESWVYMATGTDFSGLSFVPGKEDWFEVRIKFNSVAALNNPSIIKFDLELHRDNKNLYKIAHSTQVVPYGNLDTNRYYTVRFRLPTNSQWSNTAERTYVTYGGIGTATRFVFIPTGIKANTALDCSIDYFYIGPREKLPSLQNRHLLFDFDNTATSQYRYQSPTYDGINYDLANNWRYTADRTNAPEILSGALKLTSSADNVKDYYWVRTGADQIHSGVNYIPSVQDYCQVRLKVENGVPVSATSPYVAVYFSTNESLEVPNRNCDSIPFTLPTNEGEWVTVSFPIRNSIWYEADVITDIQFMIGGINSTEGNRASIYIDYFYVGPTQPQDLTTDHNAEVYGYDSSYTDDCGLSDGKSLFIEGKGLKLDSSTTSYSEINFTFKGTGFDLISRTGNMQGTIRVIVYDAAGNYEQNLTVTNKGEGELYQIPVVSIEDLPYGEHRVNIGVNEAKEYSGVFAPLSRGGEFYLDAIRIYEPIVAEDTVLSAYVKDKEAYPYIKEVRDVLLSAISFNALKGESEGAVFVDQANGTPENTAPPESDNTDPSQQAPEDPEAEKPEDTGIHVENHITTEISTYEKVGPKNEVYLDHNQSIAFKIRLNTVQSPVSIDVGAKSIYSGVSPRLSVGHTASMKDPASRQEWTVNTNTAMYYSCNISAEDFGEDAEGRFVYLVISNTAENSVLSITDLKFTYDSDPILIDGEETPVKRSASVGSPVSFTVDEIMNEAVQKVLNTEIPLDRPVILDESIAIRHTLNLESNITLNYVVERSVIDAYDSAVLELKLPVYEGNILTGYESVSLQPVDKGYYYYFTLDCLTAVNMNDLIEASLRLEKGGAITVSRPDVYSIATYAYSQLNREGLSPTLRKLCADLLQYGSRAQLYKGYRTDALADNLLTEEQQALLTDLDTVSFGNTNSVGKELSAPTISWAGKTLELNSKVGLKFVFSVQAYDGAMEDLCLRVSYVDLMGETCTAVVEHPFVYNEEKALYAFLFDGLTAAELRQPVTAQIFKDGSPLSCTMTYSADTYGNNKTGTLGDLCKALFAYSDSAKTFFTE